MSSIKRSELLSELLHKHQVHVSKFIYSDLRRQDKIFMVANY